MLVDRLLVDEGTDSALLADGWHRIRSISRCTQVWPPTGLTVVAVAFDDASTVVAPWGLTAASAADIAGAWAALMPTDGAAGASPPDR